MKLNTLTERLDKKLTEVWATYIDLHTELDKHRGKTLEDTDVQEVNRLLKEIQLTFAQLYHPINFIITRTQFAANAINGYNEFIEQIKKHAAVNTKEGEA